MQTRSRNAGPFVITVLSRDDAQQYRPKDGHVVMISISDPGSPLPQFFAEDTYGAMLRVQFHDIERMIPWLSFEPICDSHAHDIARFILLSSRKACNLVIHCEAGISRSAGVAAAVCTYYGNTADTQYFLGERAEHNLDSSGLAEKGSPFRANRRVYEMVLHALLNMDIQETKQEDC